MERFRVAQIYFFDSNIRIFEIRASALCVMMNSLYQVGCSFVRITVLELTSCKLSNPTSIVFVFLFNGGFLCGYNLIQLFLSSFYLFCFALFSHQSLKNFSLQ